MTGGRNTAAGREIVLVGTHIMGCGGIRRGVTGRKVVRDIMLVAINRIEITVLCVNALGILKKTHSGKNVRTRITGGAPRSLGAGTRITRAATSITGVATRRQGWGLVSDRHQR